jgi:ubiquinone/menaquinone biosynthesis C-methylase UbiE
MERKEHWEAIYKTKAPNEVSWYQERPTKSLELIKASKIKKDAAVIDVGGGASTLVDHLLSNGFRRLTVLDISLEALQKAKARLSTTYADAVTWMEGDVTQVILPYHFYDLWHDRAVFHFLTSPEDRQRYIRTLNDALKPGGHVIMATFALEGPPKCSGLEVMRYSPETLSKELGAEFKLISSVSEIHQTPSGGDQNFIYVHFVRI